MDSDSSYLIIDTRVLPEVFIKVMEAKKLLETGEAPTIQDATNKVNVSRSAFYKYKDCIYPIYDNFRGRTITVALELVNEYGLLSNILNIVASNRANILTINQNIPLNNIANVTITLETGTMEMDFADIIKEVSSLYGVNNIKIIARE